MLICSIIWLIPSNVIHTKNHFSPSLLRISYTLTQNLLLLLLLLVCFFFYANKKISFLIYKICIIPDSTPIFFHNIFRSRVYFALCWSIGSCTFFVFASFVFLSLTCFTFNCIQFLCFLFLFLSNFFCLNRLQF